jgi:signal transduction histidine kinase
LAFGHIQLDIAGWAIHANPGCNSNAAKPGRVARRYTGHNWIFTPETMQARVSIRDLGLAGVVIGTLLISLAHHTVPSSEEHWHNVFQHLYYVPIVLAALLFGWRGGLAGALLAGISHLPDILQTLHVSPDSALEQTVEIPVLCAVGFLTGIFSDRDRKQRKKIENTTRRLTEVYQELQRNFEQMKRAERLFAVGQLAAGLAHELRNPLGSVAGAAGILQRNANLDPKYQECLEIIDKESQRLNRLLTEFLDFARPHPPKFQSVDVDGLLDSVIQLAAHGVGSPAVTLRKQTAQPLPCIDGDPEMLKQLLLNLVINAVQAMPDGGDVVVAATLRDGKMLISVQDQGRGIAPGLRDKIFDPFFTTKDAGTGLGLPVAHQIVDQHGGVLTAEPRASGGMTFSALLPLRQEVSQ